MRKFVFFCSILLLIPFVAPKAGAQQASSKQAATAAPAQPVHYYHIDFTFENLDAAGKVTNSRSYSTTVDTQPHALTSIRTSTRIPVITEAFPPGPGKSATNEFQYIDLGVELDVRDVHEVGQRLALDLTANLSGEASPTQPTDPNLAHQPVIRQNRWASRVLVPIGKRTVVFTSDSLDSKGSTRVVVIATPIED